MGPSLGMYTINYMKSEIDQAIDATEEVVEDVEDAVNDM